MLIVNDRYLAVCDPEAENGVRLTGLDVIKRIEIKVDNDGQPEANQILEMLNFIRNDFDDETHDGDE